MLEIEKSILLVIDVQGKLASLVQNTATTYSNIRSLIKAAQILAIPVLYTEQMPEKIGSTIPEIQGMLGGLHPIRKTSFSCWGEREVVQQITALSRKQIIVAGIETHVCVYQTVRDLLLEKFETAVVCDAVSARKNDDTRTALRRMDKLGANLVSTEMLICELIKGAEHKNFKEIISLLKPER